MRKKYTRNSEKKSANYEMYKLTDTSLYLAINNKKDRITDVNSLLREKKPEL